MAKNKQHKLERVLKLPNVTFSIYGQSKPPTFYPWYDTRFNGMEIVLELGCGKAEYSLALAAEDSGKLCVGIDRKSHRMCVGAEAALAKGLDNVLFLRTPVERLGEFFLPHSVHEIWLTFPDPLLKKRTVKNRLTSSSFLDIYARLLIPGGLVYLKTDSELFYNSSFESIKAWGGKIITASKNIDTDNITSPYAYDVISSFERAARKKGATIKILAFTLSG